jgi:TetR/AcrR family transcriptional regulator
LAARRLILPMVNKSGSPAHPPVAEQSALVPRALVAVPRTGAVAPIASASGAAVPAFGASVPVPIPAAPRKRRGRGRPPADSGEDVRKKLLDAARDLFPRYGYRGVSSRQIGAAAGVNFAMIRYYFGGKPGLYREMLQGVLQPARSTLDAMSSAESPPKLLHVLENITRSWAANPWVAGFVVREVLAPDGPMRAMFMREFPERLTPLVERMVEGEIAAGKLRSDLDPRLLVLSIVSLAIFPFLTLPLTTSVFGVRNDEKFVERFLHHTAELLARGAGPAAFSI